jgi:hypothetical protein
LSIFVAPFRATAGGLTSGLFVEGVTESGESLVVSTTIAPTFLEATTAMMVLQLFRMQKQSICAQVSRSILKGK